MADSLMRKGIDKLEEKYIPQVAPNTAFVPSEQYRSIMPLLDIWGYQDNDKDVSEKGIYIYDNCVAINKDKPQDALTSILTDLGATKWNESKLERVYRYFRLKGEADKVLAYHGLLNKEIDELRGK
jgi:hypothetical protein